MLPVRPEPFDQRYLSFTPPQPGPTPPERHEPAPARASPPDEGAAARAAANRALLDRRFYTAFKPPRKLFKKRKRAPANATLAT